MAMIQSFTQWLLEHDFEQYRHQISKIADMLGDLAVRYGESGTFRADPAMAAELRRQIEAIHRMPQISSTGSPRDFRPFNITCINKLIRTVETGIVQEDLEALVKEVAATLWRAFDEFRRWEDTPKSKSGIMPVDAD
jgi:hypothetical protein